MKKNLEMSSMFCDTSVSLIPHRWCVQIANEWVHSISNIIFFHCSQPILFSYLKNFCENILIYFYFQPIDSLHLNTFSNNVLTICFAAYKLQDNGNWIYSRSKYNFWNICHKHVFSILEIDEYLNISHVVDSWWNFESSL